MRRNTKSDFEWRASFGSLRWLILGTLGLGHACGGRTETALEPSQSGRDSSSAEQDGGVGGNHGAMTNTAGSVGLPGAGAGGSGSIDPGGAAGTGSSQPSACIFAESLEGGMERCQNGMLHRVASGSCSSTVPRPNSVAIDDGRLQADAGFSYECLQDSDCTAKPYGHCERGQGGPYCAYGCTVDAECGADQLCLCASPVGECMPASCRSDAECGPGLLCASNEECYFTRFSCQQPTDECAVSSDCGVPFAMCRYAELEDIDFRPPPEGARRICQSFGCPVIGRPFLVDGAERLAPPVSRADWYSGASSAAPALTAELARAVAQGWTEQALMEHASVAAFARFALQLLSLGAPAALVDDTARALADELRHARDCFRLARRHLPADVGPGPLPVHGALAHTSLHEIVLTTVLEGCIGETVAALEASEALAHCEDVEARAVLERIAQDEGEHAQLAWRFVAWALTAAPPAERAALRARVEKAFREELAAPVPPPASDDFDRALAGHGLLSAGVRRALRQRVLAEVVAPCAAALLAAPRAPTASVSSLTPSASPSSLAAT